MSTEICALRARSITHGAILSLFALVALSPLPSSAAYVDEVLADGPSSWWRFEDASSTSGSTAVDGAGAFDGTYSGNVSFAPSAPGITGQAARFDGAFDSVRFGNLGALPTQGTIEFWIYPEAVQSNRNPFTTGPLGSTVSGNRAIRFEAKDAGHMVIFLGDDTATTQPQFGTTIAPSMAANAWHHVVVTWDTSAETITGYFDGEEIFHHSNTFFPSQMSDVRVGMGWGNFLDRSWLGRVDEVALYTSALGAGRILVHYAAGAALPPEHFLAYKIKPTKGSTKFVKFGPISLTDQFRTSDYDVLKPTALLLPADKNGEGRLDENTHLEEYKLKPDKNAAAFEGRTDVGIMNQCSDALLEIGKPMTILVPTAKDLDAPTAPPAGHNLDHFLCYKAKLQKTLADGTKLPKFPRGTQVDVEDQFETRRYDLKKITKFCTPVSKSGAPVLLAGPDRGTPKPITAAVVRNPDDHLVCYQAKIATRNIPQLGCGALDPKDKGAVIEPKPAKHEKISGIHVANQFEDAGRIDSIKAIELCIPSVTVPDGSP